MGKFPAKLMRVLNKHRVNIGDGSLLTLALTHKSWAFEVERSLHRHNERLEFLGDAVLELVVTEKLYHMLPKVPEGDLARMRAAIVCEQALFEVSQSLQIGQGLKLGVGEERGGGRHRPSLLANAFEAVIGAIYLLAGWDGARRVLLDIFASRFNDVATNRAPTDAKSRLQELVQSKCKSRPHYRLVKETGPDHDKRFVSEVVFNDDVLGRGSGLSKRMSEQAAAQNALKVLRKDPGRLRQLSNESDDARNR